MRANGAKILFIPDYAGSGASVEQFVETFELSNIKVIFRRDVDAAKPFGEQSGTLTLPPQ
jgi:hypothetical protein